MTFGTIISIFKSRGNCIHKKLNYESQTSFIFAFLIILIRCSNDDDINPSSDIQYTAIPDKNFEQALIELGIDTDGVVNRRVATPDILEVKSLDISYKGITDLTGIENFINLTDLFCRGNKLSSLNVGLNTFLKILRCDCNQLTSLNVSNNTLLNTLGCNKNELTKLDVRNNTSLTCLTFFSNHLKSLDVSNNSLLLGLYCGNNQLASLDISNNSLLTSVYCGSNQLSSLDVSNITSLAYLSCNSNPLTCIKVNQYQLDNLSDDWFKDSDDIYALDCN